MTDRDSDDSKEQPEEQPSADPAPEESPPGFAPAPRHTASAVPEPPTTELPQPAFGPSVLPSEVKTTEIKTTEAKTAELRQRPHPPAPAPARNGGGSGWPTAAAEPRPGQRGEAPPTRRPPAPGRRPPTAAPVAGPAPAGARANGHELVVCRGAAGQRAGAHPQGAARPGLAAGAALGDVRADQPRAVGRRACARPSWRPGSASLLRGHYKIGVLGKGGVGKTTVAAVRRVDFGRAAPGRPGGGHRRRHRVRQAGQPGGPARGGLVLGAGRRPAPGQLRRHPRPGRQQRRRAVRAGRRGGHRAPPGARPGDLPGGHRAAGPPLHHLDRGLRIDDGSPRSPRRCCATWTR